MSAYHVRWLRQVIHLTVARRVNRAITRNAYISKEGSTAIMSQLRIVFDVLTCYLRIARIRMKMAGEIKSRKVSQAFLYSIGLAYASAVIGISIILSSVPKPQSMSQLIGQEGLAILALVASLYLIKIGKMLPETDARLWRLDGDLRFHLVQERLKLRRLKEAW